MRKVEQDMLDAIKLRRDWTGGNTQVVHDNDGLETHVFLHGNHIAALTHCKRRFASAVYPNRMTVRDYPTRTTMSRLRALGVDVCIKGGLPFIDGEVLLPREDY